MRPLPRPSALTERLAPQLDGPGTDALRRLEAEHHVLLRERLDHRREGELLALTRTLGRTHSVTTVEELREQLKAEIARLAWGE